DVRALAFSPGGEKLLAAAAPGLTAFDVASGRGERYTAFGAAPRALAWAPDGATFAVARGDASVALGALGHASPVSVVPMLGSPTSLALDDGRIMTSDADGSVAVRSLSRGRVLDRAREPGVAARALVRLPGSLAASMSDGSVRFFLPQHERAVVAVYLADHDVVAVAPDGHVEARGDGARDALACRLGAVLVPFDVCAEQFVVKDLLALALSGKDPAEADP
ncbi:MAG TPA: hypothetical protein VHB21_21045, partial [Minicystis sp.]|nr:hypothetical protein [Minicystis sp.]